MDGIGHTNTWLAWDGAYALDREKGQCQRTLKSEDKEGICHLQLWLNHDHLFVKGLFHLLSSFSKFYQAAHLFHRVLFCQANQTKSAAPLLSARLTLFF